jgi:hypothetical protein
MKMLALNIKQPPISVVLSKAKDPGEAGTAQAHQGVLTMPMRKSQECLDGFGAASDDGILRLRERFASRSTHSAQDDRLVEV